MSLILMDIYRTWFPLNTNIFACLLTLYILLYRYLYSNMLYSVVTLV